MKTSIFRNYKFYLSVFAALCLSGILWIQFAHASILQANTDATSELPSWTSRVSLLQTINLSEIASSSEVTMDFISNYGAIPLFDIGLGGWTDISGMGGTIIATSSIGSGKIVTRVIITSSTLINAIANNTTAIKFFVCNDAPACASNVIYGTATNFGFANPYWWNNIDQNTGNDTNLKTIYFMIYDTISANTITSQLNYDFGYATTTPGFLSNATTTQDWLTSIWDSTSTSGFSVDCSGYSGDIFSSSTLGAIGCYAQKIPMGIAGMLITPMPFATNYISDSFSKIQNVFPFSLVFGLRNELQTTIEDTDTATSSVLSIPIYGHGSFDVLGPTTLQDIVGVEMKDKIFTVIKSVIWLSTGIGLFLLI